MADQPFIPDLAEAPVRILVETVITVAPWLLRIPVLGALLLLLAPEGGNDFRAIEDLERAANKRKTERKTRIERNARYVLKASDAMKCVEENILGGSILLAFGKGLLNIIARRIGDPLSSAPDLLMDAIFTCIEQKTLTQTNRRTKFKGTYYARPSRGHGHGRVTGKG